jgi:signal peptidase I
MPSRSSRKRKAKAAKEESAWSVARFLLTLAILAWAVRSFIFQPFSIPSGSMLPTLFIGDYVLVAKWPFGYSRYSFPFDVPPFRGRIFDRLPKRGDVVVFRHPARAEDLVKRVIGVPGDRIAMANGQLILNGQAVMRRKLKPFAMPISANSPCKMASMVIPRTVVRRNRPYCLFQAFLETLPGGPSYEVLTQLDHGPADDFPPVEVPRGRLFVMGDNRDDSLDSRYPIAEGGVAMLPSDHVIGRALVTAWSTDGAASYFKPWTWFSSLRASRIGNGYNGEAE